MPKSSTKLLIKATDGGPDKQNGIHPLYKKALLKYEILYSITIEKKCGYLISLGKYVWIHYYN